MAESRKKVIKVTYDFTSQGGAVGDISLGETLPKGAIVTGVFHDEITNVTSGGAATGTLYAGSQALTGAIALATFSGTTSEALAGSANAIKMTTNQALKLTIGTAAYTAGKVDFYIEYMY